MTIKNNRVYGLLGIRSSMSNWNADFSGRPKTTSKNEMFGSDKALKYPMRVYWEQAGYPVLYFKSLHLSINKKGEEALQPRTLKERYEMIFESTLEKKENISDVLKNLFSAVDVMNFGATFAEEGQNISITGAVQIGQGMNMDKDTMVEVQDILSPFKNSADKKKDATQSSLGTKIVSDEAHYCYPFSVNPFVYNNYVSIVEGFDGYSESAYSLFKEAALKSTTLFATNSKFGCDNEYALFIELKDHSKLALPSLNQYLVFEKENEKIRLDFSGIFSMLTSSIMEEIELIELHYDPFAIICTGYKNIDVLKTYNIYTGEAI